MLGLRDDPKLVGVEVGGRLGELRASGWLGGHLWSGWDAVGRGGGGWRLLVGNHSNCVSYA